MSATDESAFPEELRADLASKLVALTEEPAATAVGGPNGIPSDLRPIRMLKERAGETTELLEDGIGCRYVRKRFPRHDASLLATYRALAKLDSPSLARMYAVHERPGGIEVLRAYIDGPTLRTWIHERGPLPEEQARALLARVARGAQALHSCNPPIIHRDINPNNVVMGPAGPCLIDFGIARPFNPAADRDTHTWGTHGYAAPEQFGFGQSDARTDIFALGMLYWFLLTGTDPDANLRTQLAHITPSEARTKGLSPFSCELIEECVTLDPANRFSSTEALINALGLPAQAARVNQKEATEPSSPAASTVPSAPTSPAPAATASTPSASAAPSASPMPPAAGPAQPASSASSPAQSAPSGQSHRSPLTAAPAVQNDGKASDATSPKSARRKQAGRIRAIARGRTLLTKLWTIASTLFMIVLMIGVIAYVTEPWRLAYPEALFRAAISSIGVLLFFAPTWLTTANPFGLRDRLTFLQEHRLRRSLALIVGGVALGTAIIVVASANLSPEYVQIAQQNGSNGV